jgi:hypothetical protein
LADLIMDRVALHLRVAVPAFYDKTLNDLTDILGGLRDDICRLVGAHDQKHWQEGA